MSRQTGRVAVLLLLAFGVALSAVAQGPTRILVRPCSAGEDCQQCGEPEIQGLQFKTPGQRSAMRQRVSCARAQGAPRCREGAAVQWRFQQLRSGESYRVLIEYDPDTDKYATPPPPFVFEDVFGTVNGSGSGPTFTVTSPSPTTAQRVWPYAVFVFRTTGGADQLVACADPEIIIDP